jgi:hypothetical protein
MMRLTRVFPVIAITPLFTCAAETEILSQRIKARGQDFVQYENVIRRSDNLGNEVIGTNRFTLLENGLNFRDENNQWQFSESVIEPFADGAVARRGPQSKPSSALSPVRRTCSTCKDPEVNAFAVEFGRCTSPMNQPAKASRSRPFGRTP